MEKTPLQELRAFKENAKNIHFNLYAQTKKRVLRYRLAFLIIGLFFIGLSWIIWIKSSLWITFHIKPFIDLIAFGLGIASLTICALLRTETEAVRTLYHQNVLRLIRSYRIQQSKTMKDHSLPLLGILRKKFALRAHFFQTKGKMKKLELDTLDLIHKINHTPSLSLKEKETLYSQVLQELSEHFNPIVKAYEEGFSS